MTESKTIAAKKIRQQLTEQTVSREQFAISKFLSILRFPQRLWGVDEDAVWRAMERLSGLYEDALTAERMKRELAERKLEALCRMEQEKDHG